MRPTLGIIIVNWNSGPQLRDCICSIAIAKQEDFIFIEVVIVDNSSTDGSFDGIDQLGVSVRVIRNSENRGFAAACNQGAAQSSADYLLFLNPDTLLFADSVSAPIDFMEQEGNALIGICGVKLCDERGLFSVSCARFPSVRTFFGAATGLSMILPRLLPPHLMTSAECERSGVVDQVIGAFFLVRRDLFRHLKGFDERFFVYYEEVDFSLRAKKLGYSSYLLTESSAYHKGGGSSGSIKATRLFYSLRSRLQYADKHFSPADKVVLVAITLVLEFGSRIFAAVLKRRPSQFSDTVSGYRKLLGYLIGGLINGH